MRAYIYIWHKTIYKGTHSTRPLVTPQYMCIERFVVCTVSFSIISSETFTLRNPIGIRYYFIYIYASGLPTTKPRHHKEEKKNCREIYADGTTRPENRKKKIVFTHLHAYITHYVIRPAITNISIIVNRVIKIL